MDLKDLKLNDLIKIAITATISILLTLNLSIASNNTTTINNYINKTTQKLNDIQETNEVLQKVTNETQSNITKVKTDLSKNLALSKEILNQVD